MQRVKTTALIEYASVPDASSDVDSEVSVSAEVADDAKVEGVESHHGNIGNAGCNSAMEAPGTEPSTGPTSTDCVRKTLGCGATRKVQQPAQPM